MKVVTVKLSPTSKEFPAAYFAPDVFSELDDNVKFEGLELQKITADLLTSAGYLAPGIRVYVAKVFHVQDNKYEVFYLDSDGVSVQSKVIEISFFHTATTKARTNAFAQQIELKVTDTEEIPDRYKPSANSKVFDLLNKSIASRKQLKISNAEKFKNGVIIPPKRPAPPQLRKRYTTADYSSSEAERVFTNLAATNKYIRDELTRYASYKANVNAKKAAAGKELTEIRAKGDPLVTSFAEQQLVSLNESLQITLDKIESIEDKIQETLENAEKDSAQDWADCANEKEQLFFSKQLLIWALYHAAGTYLEKVQQDKIEDRDVEIVELNKCFAGVVKVEHGIMTDIEEAYRNLASLSLKDLQGFVNHLLKLCDTSISIGWWDSRKLTIVKETVAKTASMHPRLFGAAYEVEKRNFTWTSDVHDYKKKLDAKIEAAQDRILARFRELIKGFRLPVTEEARSAEKQSFEESADDAFAHFQSQINEYATLRNLHARAGVLDHYVSAKKAEAEETLLRIQELLAKTEEASNARARSETLIKNIRENADKVAQFRAEITAACERGKHLLKENSLLRQELTELENSKNIIDANKAALDVVLQNCQADVQARKQAQAQRQLLQIQAELASAADRKAQSGTPANRLPERLGSRHSSQDDLLLLEHPGNHHENQQQPKGFFKRHFGKLLGGGIGVAAGAGIGALAGFFLAPITFGLSIPLFAAIGAVVGGAIIAGGLGTGIGAIVDYHSNNKALAPDPEKGLPHAHQQNDETLLSRNNSLRSSTSSLNAAFVAAQRKPSEAVVAVPQQKPLAVDVPAQHNDSDVDVRAALESIDFDTLCAEIERLPGVSANVNTAFGSSTGSSQPQESEIRRLRGTL